uniref:glycosyltransferase family 2 protein n=1 Tax=uncultured Acinetobacter sp. TaxID=165433 RepID=UPI002617FADA|nr:glycosyltransferase family A protein [uncultured Acinetobacter sp.]
MKYDVAIVTPFYNTEDYLHRCIQSVLDQKDINLQYFLIDDGSTDRSAYIAKYYADKDDRITFIQQENKGQGPARNLAIKKANAEFVYFVDSDDYLFSNNTLSILYKTALEHNLDVCSPDVPKHYFEKPLEAIACIPCKSQFIRMDLIRKFDILQPDARSGQDGVFSHLALTHCQRIGMTAHAKFHYTHAREGSTFSAYLKNHDAVSNLIKIHFETIEAHYNKFNLWGKNALRLLNFITDETIRNRFNPHYIYFTDKQKIECLDVLKPIISKALDNLDYKDKHLISPVIIYLNSNNTNDIIESYGKEWLELSFTPKFSENHNIVKNDLVVCKIANKKYQPENFRKKVVEKDVTAIQGSVNTKLDSSSPNFDSQLSRLQSDVKSLKGKLDLLLNTMTNSTAQIVSSIRNKPTNLSVGQADLIVSLTTLPHRLPLVHYAIESIFSQTVLPTKVVLWITDSINEHMITPELKSLISRGLEIKKVKDVGPHTKLIYALKAYPTKSIVTVDDDIIYPINMLQYLWDQHTKHPKAIVANWARELAFDTAGQVKGVRAGKLLTPVRLENEIEQAELFESRPNLIAFPYGTSGVLYPPKALHEKVIDVSLFRKLCPKEDDIWFKAMAILNKTPVVVTNLGINPVHHSLTGTQLVALRHDNHGLSQNEQQMRAVFDYFNLYKLLK